MFPFVTYCTTSVLAVQPASSEYSRGLQSTVCCIQKHILHAQQYSNTCALRHMDIRMSIKIISLPPTSVAGVRAFAVDSVVVVVVFVANSTMWGRVPTALAKPVAITLPNIRPNHAPLTLTFQTNRLARLAPSSAVLTANSTTILATLAHPTPPQSPSDPLSLLVDFRAKAAALGIIPATWTRREAQPALSETLTARLIDRSLRPALSALSLPALHLSVSVLSAARIADAPTDALAVNAAAATLAAASLSIPPLAAARVARVRGRFIPFPSDTQLAAADLSAFAAVSSDGGLLALSVHARSAAAQEADAVDAVAEAAATAGLLLPAMRDFQVAVTELREREGKSSFPPQPPKSLVTLGTDTSPVTSPEMDLDTVYAVALDRYEAAFVACREFPGKAHRAAEMTAAQNEILSEYPHAPPDVLGRAARTAFRTMLRRDGVRMDGRTAKVVRPIRVASPALPGAVHGSALFERGDTQVLACATVGLRERVRRTEEYVAPADGGIYSGSHADDFFVHYSFPPYATGTAGRFAGTSNRREIGHSALTERALAPLLHATATDGGRALRPYALRVSAEVLSSDGSSSMASVCAGSLALMDCGAPLRQPVAGIAMGLVSGENADEEDVVLTDILGAEDHFGDMDMKVAGTSEGVTAVQMDTKKATGLSIETIARVLEDAKIGRQTILQAMTQSGVESPSELPDHAPRYDEVSVSGEQSRLLLRDRATVLRGIQEQSGTRLIYDDRRDVIEIEAPNRASAEKARTLLLDAVSDVEIGTKMMVKVADVGKTFARMETVGGTVSGILHISKMQLNSNGDNNASEGAAATTARSYPDARRVLSVGDEMEVVVLESDSSRGVLRFGLLDPPKLATKRLSAEIDALLGATRARSTGG